MSDETKCCGNCRWWKQYKTLRSGECTAPTPDSVNIASNRSTRNTDGTDCPCFSPPIPQEVLAAVKEYKDWREQYPAECGYLRTDKLPGVIADYFIQHNLQLKGNQ